MVAELLARSPIILLATANILRPSTMAAPGMTPGEDFVKPGIGNEEFFEINIGETMIRVGITGVMGLVGASALGEARATTAEKLADTFGKYKKETTTTSTDDSCTETSDTEVALNANSKTT